MKCWTGGTPGSRGRGSVHLPISNSSCSHGGTFRHASTKKNWSANCVVSKYSHSDRSAIEWSVLTKLKSVAISALSSRFATRAVSPCPAKKKYSRSPCPPLSAIRLLIATTMFDFVPPRAFRLGSSGSESSLGSSTSTRFSGGTSPPAGSRSHSRTASASRTAPWRCAPSDQYRSIPMTSAQLATLLPDDGDEVGHGLDRQAEGGDAVGALRQRPELRLVPPVALRRELPARLLARLDVLGLRHENGARIVERPRPHADRLRRQVRVVDVERLGDLRGGVSPVAGLERLREDPAELEQDVVVVLQRRVPLGRVDLVLVVLELGRCRGRARDGAVAADVFLAARA